jgi:hypothetical protein
MQLLKEIFPKYEVIAVPVSGALQLKSLVMHIDTHTLVAPTGEIGDALLSEMEAAKQG